MSHIAQRILDQRASSLRPPLGVVPAGAISLALGEPDFPTPEPIANAGNKAVSEGNTRYTDQHGLRSLREKLVSALPSSPTNKDWDADNVVVTHGATAALGAVFFALLSPGDKVVIPEPAYSLYADLVTLAGGEVVYAKLGKDLHFDIEELKEKLPGAKAIVFSNPSNPNGIVHTKHELEELGKLLEGSSTLVISDEAYSSLTYSGHDFTSALEVESLAPRTLYVQTFSKKYAMTGWRVGYVAGDKELIAAIAQFHRTFNGSLNNAAQIAAEAALDLPDSALQPMLDEYAARRELMVELLNEVPGIETVKPEGAFYSFIHYEVDKPSVQVARELGDAGVIVRAGAEYGPSAEHHIRISFAASQEEIRRGFSIIRDYFASQ